MASLGERKIDSKPYNRIDKLNTTTLILILLLVIDTLLLMIFLSHRLLGEPTSSLFNIGRDHGFPEFYQYIKEIWISLVLFITFLRQRHFSILIWSFIGGLLFLDDVLQLHERSGHFVSNLLVISGTHGIRGQDFGEVIAAAVLGLPPLVLLALCYRRDPREIKEFSRNMFVLLAGLVFFGVVINLFVHGLQSLILFIIEDWGEMILIALMLWFTLRYYDTGKTGLFSRLDQIFSSHHPKP